MTQIGSLRDCPYEGVFVMASKAGAPTHPAWFHNLRANPSVTVELGDRSFQAQAVVTEGRSATGSTA